MSKTRKEALQAQINTASVLLSLIQDMQPLTSRIAVYLKNSEYTDGITRSSISEMLGQRERLESHLSDIISICQSQIDSIGLS